MSSVFYDHLILLEEIAAVLNRYNLPDSDKEEVLDLVDQQLHHAALDTILTHLPQIHHQEFLSQMYSNPNDESLLIFIKEKASVDIEREIVAQAKKVKQEILRELRLTTKKHK